MWFYSGKEVLLEKSGCIRSKFVFFGQNACILAKLFVFGQKGCIREKVEVFGEKLLYSGKSGFIRVKGVVFRQKWL